MKERNDRVSDNVGPVFGLSHSSLHIIAMLIMLCDHVGGTLLKGQVWMRYVGRLAFPIFCFLLVEGFYHTHNKKKYLTRLAVFGLISELPFDLALFSRVYWKAQNVMWTFLIGLVCLIVLGKVKTYDKLDRLYKIALSILVTLGFCWLADMFKTDYSGAGVLQIVIFYYLRSNSFRIKALQLPCVWWINSQLLGTLYRTHEILGMAVKVHLQTYAVLSLVFIWLYNGKKGIKSKVFKWVCYLFYPVHLSVLYLLSLAL